MTGNEVPDMSNAHFDGDRPACEGEDPQIFAGAAKATQDLADFLKLHDIEVDYWGADWKDTEGLIEGAHELILKHPGWQLHYIGGGTFGMDSNYVFLTSKEVREEVVEKIGEYIVEYGAELPEEVVPPKPVCPKCGKEIEGLFGSYPAVVPGFASICNGELNLQLQEELKLWEVICEDGVAWHCPECDTELFKAGQEDEMTAFLKCETKEENND